MNSDIAFVLVGVSNLIAGMIVMYVWMKHGK